jgi:hypothetical protein
VAKLVVVLAAICCILSATTAPALLPPEFAPRGGLPRLAAKLSAPASSPATDIRVAFLGGSITASKGWRVGILAHLRQTYPRHHFTEIFAALPGTGSDFGAARLRDDVLRHTPDLLFVEFAVNDTGRDPAAIRRSMEGIVRQTRLHSPATDLCFVYTLSHSGLPDLEAERFPPPAAAMEDVAAHYGIPTHHFGVEIVRQLHAGALVFTGTAPSPDIPVFAPDKVHPGSVGHRLYTESLARQLPSFLAARPSASTTPLPSPLDPANWENARLASIADLAGPHASAWTRVPADDLHLSAIPNELRHDTFVAQQPGTVLEFTFIGTAFGFYGIKGPDAGRFRVTIDDLPPVDGAFFDSFCVARRYRAMSWLFPKPLADARHHVRVELLDTGPDKTAVRARSPEDDPAFDLHALTLSGVILVGSVPPP